MFPLRWSDRKIWGRYPHPPSSSPSTFLLLLRLLTFLAIAAAESEQLESNLNSLRLLQFFTQQPQASLTVLLLFSFSLFPSIYLSSSIGISLSFSFLLLPCSITSHLILLSSMTLRENALTFGNDLKCISKETSWVTLDIEKKEKWGEEWRKIRTFFHFLCDWRGEHLWVMIISEEKTCLAPNEEGLEKTNLMENLCCNEEIQGEWTKDHSNRYVISNEGRTRRCGAQSHLWDNCDMRGGKMSSLFGGYTHFNRRDSGS